MVKKKTGEGRGLDRTEVAIIKRMIANNEARDKIMSFFIRPGRVISPAAVSEILSGKIGRDVEQATELETQRFMSKRLSEFNPFSLGDVVGRTSPTIIREVLQASRGFQRALPGFENSFNEYKRQMPKDKLARAKIAKAIAAFANANGGYIFFGIEDTGEIVGLGDQAPQQKDWDHISSIIVNCFAPAVSWSQSVVDINGLNIGVIYIPEALSKPIIATADFTDEIKKSGIYYRYPGQSCVIEPGDLMHLLSQRDRILLASRHVDKPS